MSTSELPTNVTEFVAAPKPAPVDATPKAGKAAKAPKAPKAAKAPKAPKTPRASKSSKQDGPQHVASEQTDAPRTLFAARPRTPELVVGAEPRVDLLPPEVKAQRELAALRDKLLLVVGVVLVVVLIGVGGAWYLAQQAQQDLAAEQARTATLLAAQQRYKKVAALESENELWQTAQHVAGATEIDWQDYLVKVQQTLPDGVQIQSVKVDSETPLAAYAQPSSPLLGARVATITFTASSAELPDVPRWLDALKTLTGYADANPDSVDLNAGEYAATITMHVNTGAFDNRFATKEK